jgi:hypothetical protein
MWLTLVAHVAAPILRLTLALEGLQHVAGVVVAAALGSSRLHRVDSQRAPQRAPLHTLR